MSHPAPLLAQDQPAPSAPQMLPATVPNAPPTDLPLAPAHDLSPLGMYNQAHWVVKAVMLSLLAACFATWTIWLFKTVELLVARQRARQSGRILARAATLDEATGRLGSRRDPATVMALAVAEEYGRSAPAIAPAGTEGIKERAQSLVARIEGQTLARARRGTGVLATIGAIAPFVGLFGTVWGIMNSFIGIAESKTTNLAVVAPGIAEALLATAIGLVAAIPAVVIYNQFSRSLAAYRLLLGDAAAAVLRLLSRDIDFRSMKG
ncbi:tonB-system energizer ExbB [Gemmobacter denitrificans]